MDDKLLKRVDYYFRVWTLMSKNSFMIYLNNKPILLIFLIGKVLRFTMFFAFLYFLVMGANEIAGYNVNQTIFFFLTFNIVDVLSQFLFREVYRFRTYVVNGDFDLILVKPVKPLFRVLMGGADIIDLITLLPLLLTTWYIGQKILVGPLEVIYYIFLIFNGLLITMAFYILVLAFGIITLEIDHSVMIFRDLTKLGSLPIDIYKEPLKTVLTYIIPIGLMISFPVKAFLGMISIWGFLSTFIFGVLAVGIALKFWNFALTKYSSASS